MTVGFVKSKLCSIFQQNRNVLFVESAEYQRATNVHDAAEQFHVFKQDVAVDVCHHYIKYAADMVENAAVSEEYFHIVNAIEDSIMFGILNAPFVDVISYNIFGS